MKKEENEIVLVDGYLKIAEEEGFWIVLIVPFVDDESAKENFYVLFHREYGLLAFDTYKGKVNEGKFYYNLKLPRYEYSDDSGEWYKKHIWIGNCECREGLELRSRLKNLRERGQFVTPWVKQPSLWLLHYTDEKTPYDYKAINKERIAQLPEEIQKAICP